MLSLAHRACLSSDLAEADPAAFVAILRSLEDAIVVLCEGQYLDIRGEGSLETTSAQYATMIGRKTAALIGEVAWVGARTAGVSRAVLDAARSFGTELGLAFQIRDDILGIWGDEGETGKSASSDIAPRLLCRAGSGRRRSAHTSTTGSLRCPRESRRPRSSALGRRHESARSASDDTRVAADASAIRPFVHRPPLMSGGHLGRRAASWSAAHRCRPHIEAGGFGA